MNDYLQKGCFFYKIQAEQGDFIRSLTEYSDLKLTQSHQRTSYNTNSNKKLLLIPLKPSRY